jgi:hypothetical protein
MPASRREAVTREDCYDKYIFKRSLLLERREVERLEKETLHTVFYRE